MGYRAYKEEGFIPGEYKMRCYLPDEDFRDFYFAGEGSYTAQHPVESFPWNKDIIFVGEVSEEEYNKQFKEQQAEQLELF